MTNRQPSSKSKSKSTRSGMRDRLRRKRRENRQTLLQSLESRQLLAGPDLIGIQPNEGALIRDDNTTVLTTSPRELVFQFDDATQIDPDTLSAIRITRAGEDQVFESATALTDLQSGGTVLFEFRAREQGTIGNGIQVNVTADSNPSRFPVISVSGRTVNIELSNQTGATTVAQDLINALTSNTQANALIEVIQVSGSSFAPIGSNLRTGDEVALELQGANSAQAVTDFGTNLAAQVRLVSQLPGVDGRGTEFQFEHRNFGGAANPVIVVTGQSIRVQLNSAPDFETTAADFIEAINTNPDASRLVKASLERGEGNTVIGGLTSGPTTLALGGVSDVVVEPGYVGLGDSSREVVFRFNEPLPDDIYQIDILGTGLLPLTNVDAEEFNDGIDLSRRFEIDLGPKVAAVVPEPVRRQADGSLSPETGKIEVHFNDDRLDSSLANNPSFYQLVFTHDTVDNTDDTTIPPTSVVYNNLTNIALLDFGGSLARLSNPKFDPTSTEIDERNPTLIGAARLRVGTIEGTPAPPTEFDLLHNGALTDAGDSFAGAIDLQNNPALGSPSWTVSSNETSSVTLSSEIFNVDTFGLTTPGPDVPGVREIRAEDPTRLLRTVPLDHLRNGADVINGISVIQYNFRETWLGDDPSFNGVDENATYFNIISEEQKQRVREVMQLYSEYLGVSFVEVEGQPTSQAFFSIAVGDLYGGDIGATSAPGGLAVVTRDTNGDGINDLGVMDFRDFEQSDDDQFGGEFFRGAMFAIGQLLGYGYADDLPQPVSQSTSFIFSPGTDTEASFPSVADIVHGQYLYRPDSTDIDMYKFTLSTAGTLSAETIAERLASSSLLDTQLRLYKQDANGAFVEIAQNDDYTSNDSLIELEVSAGTYFIGVSASGNDSYDPAIEGTGYGGLSEGEYELRLDFRPDSGNTIRDLTGQRLDGDSDGQAGGVFDFWFVPADPNNTLYVDKASSGASNGLQGTVGNPYREIDQAISAAQPGDTIRILGNGGVDGLQETTGDNYSYHIGFDNNSFPLQDGTSIDLPQGVRMVIDSGAILKFNRARLSVGSTSPNVDRSDSALQILGTPTIIGANGAPARDATNATIPGSVYLTSFNDSSIGNGNPSSFTTTPQGGDWGGVDFRGDLDVADESRRFREDEGVFLNHIQYANIRYGGGAISNGGRQVVISPIEMAVTRPTIINSYISDSSDAAIAASPRSFTETRFTEPRYQAAGAFTPDFSRVGPNIYGNTIVDNSINGLFIRVTTRAGDVAETITNTARFDDTDITHVLTENLVIAGTAGGPILISSAPSSLLIRSFPTTVGNVPAGNYTYRVTNVNAQGLESAASQQTIPITLGSTGGVQLSGLPAVAAGEGFTSRRLYRATVDANGLPGQFQLVANLNASSTTYVDRVAAGTTPLASDGATLQSRLDGSLKIDAGTILKIDSARIEARFGANLIAEGDPSVPIVFTSLEDQRYGTGGTFDTNDRGNSGAITPGDWGGIYIGHGSNASLDNVVVAGAGGTTRIEGEFASFNALEVHQANLRLANSRFELNADGRGATNGTRVGRGDNAEGSLFVLASTPTIINNEFVDSTGPAISFDVNSLSHVEVTDAGRSSGPIEQHVVVGNSGPLVEGNSLTGNTINAMEIRGGQLTTTGVWDDVDIVHVVRDTIEIPNQHVYGGLRLQSDARGSLVVKFENGESTTAGLVAGGTLASASDQFVDIADRIGGSLQVLGHADFPVILTTLADDTAGAGFDKFGRPQVDTNGDGNPGITVDDDTDNNTTTGPVFGTLPAGPEVNNGLAIDNDVDPNIPGFFEATIASGGEVGSSNVTVQVDATGQLLLNQDYIFRYSTYVVVGGTSTQLSATTITQPATLIADDVVESRGTFAGPNGTVNWISTSRFDDGVATLFSTLEMTTATGLLGDIRVVNYLDEDVNGASDDLLFTTGTPGEADFRAFTVDGPTRVGFSHGGYYSEDGTNQVNATYAGWAADEWPELSGAIVGATQQFSVAGTIDTTSLTQFADAVFGTAFGPEDITTAFAWDVTPTAPNATVTSFLQLLASDPANDPGPTSIDSGLWNGVTIREGASDRNVAAVTETEPVRKSVFDTNAIPSQSQFLGEIAPNEASGDENRRLGFVVEGAITTKSDLDVYSFVAESGTEVWLDIDRTSNSLDTIVELIDVNGRILAASDDSLLAETNSGALYTALDVDADAAQPLSVVPERAASQTIQISESVVDATAGTLTLSVDAATPVLIDFTDFLANPATSIRDALTANFPEVGNITVALQPRTERATDPQNPATVIRNGSDFAVNVLFNQDEFPGQDPPVIGVGTSGVIGPAVTTNVTQQLDDATLQDTYSTNPKDAGMRLRLPGESGTRNLYHVRVRSSNDSNPLDFSGDIRGGQTTGSYQLQIRLGETDEFPGTQIRLTDVRFAQNGLQIIGQPLHSPLLGEEYETSGPNDTLADAQQLGYYSVGNDQSVNEAGPLQSDRLSKSFAGEISDATDVDWYRFEVDYENITRDQASLFLSTVFDLDYADNLARGDMALYVFNEAGQLILVGGDSNVADDLVVNQTNGGGNNFSDLSSGSAGTNDPYIGAAELGEGVYFVAVSSQQQVPQPLDQFFNANSNNPLLRLEPVDSVTRIAEDRMNAINGGTPLYGGTASDPVVPILFDQDSIVPYTLDDVLVYVNTSNGLAIVNPNTGQNYGFVGGFGQEDIYDVAFRGNGELFGYTGFGPRVNGDANWSYRSIDTSNGALSAALTAGGGITTHHDLDAPVDQDFDLDDVSNVGFEVHGITIREFQGLESGFLVADRAFLPGIDYSQNVLFSFEESTGAITGVPNPLFEFAAGAGSSVFEIGQIDTVPLNSISRQLGISAATEVNQAGVAAPALFDGDRFTISNGTETVTYELDAGPTLIANTGQSVRDGDRIVVEDVIFEFNIGSRLAIDEVSPTGTLQVGSTATVTGERGQSATFEFVRNNTPRLGNIGVSVVDNQGQALSANQISRNLAALISTAVDNSNAVASGNEILFSTTEQITLSVTGSGVTVAGDSGLNPIDNTFPAGTQIVGVDLPENSPPDAIISALADAIAEAGFPVSTSGIQLSLPGSGGVSIASGNALSLNGSDGTTPGNVPILLLPTDTVEIIAGRIVAAIQASVDAGDLPNVSAQATGRSIAILDTGFIGQVTGGFTSGGVKLGGSVQGVELLDNDLYAVTNRGELYLVSQAELNGSGARQIGTLVDRATDLIGLNFTGLRAGPSNVDGGRYDGLLFGITANGDIHAFNRFGELQPIFAGGRSSISTGVFGAQGFDFSTLDFNLWHATGTRGGDDGHGVERLVNGARAGSNGGNSLAFTYEVNSFFRNFDSSAEQPVRFDVNGQILNPRLDGQDVSRTYNFPGGAKGVVQSNTFSLEPYASADEPVLYFNYFLNTDGVNDDTTRFGLFREDQDALRVYVVTPDGVSHLVATNNAARGAGFGDDEFDDPDRTDDIDLDVQQLFDNTGSWRQARVELGDFAGQKNLSLRVEYSTAGTTGTQSAAFRVTAGEDLFEGDQFILGGETFVINLAPAVSTPSGQELATLYADPNAAAVIVIDGQEYVLNDGTRIIGADQIAVNLLLNQPFGTALATLSASEIAESLAEAIRQDPPALPIQQNVNLSDPFDDPAIVDGRNDLIFEANLLPYSGGNLRLEGTGMIGAFDNTGAPVFADDVDLNRLDVESGTMITVNAEFVSTNGQPVPNLDPVVRFFDADGLELQPTVDVLGNPVLTATKSGPIYIGISGVGNDQYDPRQTGTTQQGQGSDYQASIDVTVPLTVLRDTNQLELNGLQTVSATPSNLFITSGQQATRGIPVSISRSMTANEVAVEVQRAVTDRFYDGNLFTVPVAGSVISIPSLTLDDAGPFVDEADRYGDQFGTGVLGGASSNDSEGVYLDDFIIGLAERGEIASNSNPVTGSFVTSGLPTLPSPADSVSTLQTGSYQVEIRDASEYVRSGDVTEIIPLVELDALGNIIVTTIDGVDFGTLRGDHILVPLFDAAGNRMTIGSSGDARFRTFDTNDRLNDARTLTALSGDRIRDGQTFSIYDGRSTVTFEFNLIDSGTGVTPGNVEVPFTLRHEVDGTEDIDPVTLLPIPGTGTVRPNTASEVAQNIIDAINRTDVQSIINVPALPSNGVDGPPSAIVNLFAEVVVLNQSGALESVGRNNARGDDNRDRDGQGVILIENSRFLYNAEFGIDISHDVTTNVAGVDTPSVVRYPRNLVELNSEAFVPGVVIQSNVIAHNEVGGLQIAGLSTAGESDRDPVSFERIVNNTIIGGTVRDSASTPGEVFQGVAFPGGLASFADAVVDYQPDARGMAPTAEHQDSSTALGAPDCNGRGPEPANGDFAVSLGRGGSITVEFTNNRLTGSDDSNPDLIVFETGEIESVLVEISRDGTTFFDVGTITGLSNRVDIDQFGFGSQDQFAFVRLTDLSQGSTTGAPLGADIDAIGALSSAVPEEFTAAGDGVIISGNAAPTLLNNIIANSATGISIDPTNTGAVLGGNTFYRNDADVPTGVSTGQFAQSVPDSEALFINATEFVFGPAAGSSVIDSSIDSLADRASLTTVKNPLGLPPSPIVAPRLDVNGQLRIDDPSVETPSGLGERVFKDRGAYDRGDQIGPRVVLLAPQAPNLGTGAGVVNVYGAVPTSFELQVLDGLAPADVVPGVGVDDTTVTSSSIILLQNNVPLVEGVDYRFGYNPSTNIIRLTPIAGVWEEDSTYVIRMVDGSDAIITASTATNYGDAGVLTIVDNQANSVSFEYETGIVADLNDTIALAGTADGIQFSVFDGSRSITFELDSDASLEGSLTQVEIETTSTIEQIAAAIATAVNRQTGFGISAASEGSFVQFTGNNPLSSVEFDTNVATVAGSIGTSTGFGFQLPFANGQFDNSIGDGDSFTIFRGASDAVTFEFDSSGSLNNPDAVAIPFSGASTLDSLANDIVRAVSGAGLGLIPSNAGFGRVALGGNANYSLNIDGTTLTPIAVPGLGANVPIPVGIDQSPEQIAATIAAIVEVSGLVGVEADIIDRRVFLEGVQQIVGVGATDVTIISDEVGNRLQSNQIDGNTRLTIFIGSGSDYGDAPAPYTSLAEDGGPRHSVNPEFALSLNSAIGAVTVTADPDAPLNNADVDDGIQLPANIYPGFAINIDVGIVNASGQDHYLDAWFDWNQNGVFENTEVYRYNSIIAPTGRSSVPVQIPSDADLGTTYARFRLSEVANLGANGVKANGEAPQGEVEDYQIIVSRNPFQNGGAGGFADVNASGVVTPLDALHVINFLSRAGAGGGDASSVDLSVPQDASLFTYAKFPDVNSNGSVTASDALQVINYLANLNITGSGEDVTSAGNYLPIADGVLASQPTVIGDSLIASSSSDRDASDSVANVESVQSKVSVFDSAATIDLDSLVDTLAEDKSSVDSDNSDSDLDPLDQVFAQL